MEKVAELGDLPRGRGLKVAIGETEILLARHGDEVRALSAACPHAGAPLAEGALRNERIICPWHKATFSLSDGALLEPPALDGLTRYPLRVEGNEIFVSTEVLEQPSAQPAHETRTFVIIGAGAGGGTAAAALREFGFGGRIVPIGREPGPPYDRTALSKLVVAGEMKKNEIPSPRPAAFYDNQKIERLDAAVTRLDIANRYIELSDGRSLTFD